MSLATSTPTFVERRGVTLRFGTGLRRGLLMAAGDRRRVFVSEHSPGVLFALDGGHRPPLQQGAA